MNVVGKKSSFFNLCDCIVEQNMRIWLQNILACDWIQQLLKYIVEGLHLFIICDQYEYYKLLWFL
jgi:hypothetical protein